MGSEKLMFSKTRSVKLAALSNGEGVFEGEHPDETASEDQADNTLPTTSGTL